MKCPHCGTKFTDRKWCSRCNTLLVPEMSDEELIKKIEMLYKTDAIPHDVYAAIMERL